MFSFLIPFLFFLFWLSRSLSQIGLGAKKIQKKLYNIIELPRRDEIINAFLIVLLLVYFGFSGLFYFFLSVVFAFPKAN